MKNIFFTLCSLLMVNGQLWAQFEGKQFLSGSAGVNFGSNNPKTGKATNGYGYDFAADFGKFKTNTMATGWRLSSSLGGGKTIYDLSDLTGLQVTSEKNGINIFSIGAGRFWQFYKPINANMGIFAGPDIKLAFSNFRQFNVSSDRMFLTENRTNRISLSAGLNAGLYYRFSEKWWINASLAFSNPIAVDYSFVQTDVEVQNQSTKGDDRTEINYSFSPSFTFPGVGFGLRYFYNR